MLSLSLSPEQTAITCTNALELLVQVPQTFHCFDMSRAISTLSLSRIAPCTLDAVHLFPSAWKEIDSPHCPYTGAWDASDVLPGTGAIANPVLVVWHSHICL